MHQTVDPVRRQLVLQRSRRRRRRTPAEVAVLVSSYQNADHLRRVLVSLALQRGVDGAMEVVVSDDGSTDHTANVVRQFARDVSFPVRFTTHPHDGFQLARCRNDGVRNSSAPYLLFLDGDCIVPDDHVRQHLVHRRSNWVMGGYCCRLSQNLTKKITEDSIRSGEFRRWIPKEERRKIRWRDIKARFYSMMGHSGKPRLAGGNIGIAHSDYESVNGYDEHFVGWGGEDDDLRRRLVARGVRIGSILRWTHTYHLWHPPAPTAAPRYWDGVNVQYLHRPGRLVRCRQGLAARALPNIRFGLADPASRQAKTRRLLQQLFPSLDLMTTQSSRPEVEFAVLDAKARFSGEAQCNVLVVPVTSGETTILLQRNLRVNNAAKPHLLLAENEVDGFEMGVTQFRLRDAAKLLNAIC